MFKKRHGGQSKGGCRHNDPAVFRIAGLEKEICRVCGQIGLRYLGAQVSEPRVWNPDDASRRHEGTLTPSA